MAEDWGTQARTAMGDSAPAPLADDDLAVNLEVDTDDTDSAIGDMTSLPSTASVRSSVYETVQENGRTYHRYKEGKYMLPNDDVEQDRLDLQHQLCLLTLDGRLHLAPIGTKVQNVLDIGTGTGIWAIDFATQHPSAHVTGTDLSPIQPNFVPPNCHFEVDDAEDEWMFSRKFDFIHGRTLFSCFKDPAAVIQSAYDALAPGGYLEFLDALLPMQCVDSSMDGTALGKWTPMCVEGAKNLGKDWTCTAKYKQYMKDAGFLDVQEVRYQWPSNTWPKARHQKVLGMWFHQDLLDGINGMSMAVLTRGLGMTPEDVELFLVDVRKDIKDRSIHAFVPMYVVYGRKPE